MARSDAQNLELYKIIRDLLIDKIMEFGGNTPVELTIRGRSRRYENPTQTLDWLNGQIEKLEKRTAPPKNRAARNHVRIMRGIS